MSVVPMLRRVVITGSECTGKTTLTRELAQHFSTRWLPEFARNVASRLARPLTVHDVEDIARGHLAHEDEALARMASEPARQSSHLLLFDTDLVSTAVYAAHYYDAQPPWLMREARSRLADLYLLADIDIPWEPDGIRDRPDAREQIQDLMRRQLAEFQASVREVRGLGPVRLELAIEAIVAAFPDLPLGRSDA